MKTKTSVSQGHDVITTINLLRQRAAEFLSVAANLEAQQKFVNFSTTGRVTGTTNITIGMGRTPPKRKMSLVARRKISKAAKARAAAKKKGLAVVAKAA